MRVQWVIPVVLLAILAMSSLPAAACIPGMPEQQFQAQAVSSGTAFPEMQHLSMTTVEEMFPQAITFKDHLYVVWQKEDFCQTVKYFVTMTSFDGEAWSDPAYLSSPDISNPIRSELNLNPRLGADDTALYLVWNSNEPNWTSGVDDDVVFRFTVDGVSWSPVIEVTGHYNTGLDKLSRVTPFKGKVWFLWETNDRVDSDGGDMDIVMRSWDGNEFGPVLEVTPPGDIYNDFNVQVAADGEHMYMMWMTLNYSSGLGGVYDIWARVFDGDDFVGSPARLDSGAVVNNEHPAAVAGDGHGFFIWETYDTGKIGDLSSVVMRDWTPEGGFGRTIVVSSLSSNGKDSKPAGIWERDQLFVSWISSDQGVTFGEDSDLVYRVAKLDEKGVPRFGDFIEVSTSSDDFEDRFPTLVVYDGVVNAVWVVDTNYTDYFDPADLVSLGGIFRSPDVVIQSIDIPFEKRLSLVYTLGTAFPVATKPTTAMVTVDDLGGDPMEGLRVGFLIERVDGDRSPSRFRMLDERGAGVYAMDELEFPKEGAYSLTIFVNEVEAGSFVVDSVPPPPSFMDRFPATTLFFIAVGAVCGVMLYRMMGSDEEVEELRVVPLGGPSADDGI